MVSTELVKKALQPTPGAVSNGTRPTPAGTSGDASASVGLVRTQQPTSDIARTAIALASQAAVAGFQSIQLMTGGKNQALPSAKAYTEWLEGNVNNPDPAQRIIPSLDDLVAKFPGRSSSPEGTRLMEQTQALLNKNGVPGNTRSLQFVTRLAIRDMGDNIRTLDAKATQPTDVEPQGRPKTSDVLRQTKTLLEGELKFYTSKEMDPTEGGPIRLPVKK